MLKIFNTLGKRKEEFKPLNPPYVTMYVCGITVNDEPHLGHIKTYVAFDIIRKYLEYKGYKVIYVQNITDVGHLVSDADEGEDKIVKKARERKIHPMEYRDIYEKIMWDVLDRMKIKRPNISPRATQHIIDIIEAVKKLIEKGFAYEVNGNVYFDITKFPEYGKLSGKKIEEMKNIRVKLEEKKHPWDFALWKRAKNKYEMSWPSPWGLGFPGWHIECSVMSMKYLGETIDIHGGGIEHSNLHHENEIAQSEALTGKKFVNYWLHTGMLYINGEKMSKSKGNFITAREGIKRWGVNALRYYFGKVHYRSEIDFSQEEMEKAKKTLTKLQEKLFYIIKSREGKEEIMEELEEFKRKFEEAMDDDFNVSKAVAEIHKIIDKAYEKAQKGLKKEEKEKLIKTLKKVNEVFDFLEFEEREEGKEFVELLVEIRKKLREKKLYDLSDEIRKRLEEKGIKLYDKGNETIWVYSGKTE